MTIKDLKALNLPDDTIIIIRLKYDERMNYETSYETYHGIRYLALMLEDEE
jgi:hypothetical protein